MRLFLLAVLLAPAFAHATTADDERITHEYERALLGSTRVTLDPSLLGPARTRLALDAVENLVAAGKLAALPAVNARALPPKEQVRWFRLGGMKEEELAISYAPPEAGLIYELLGVENKLHLASTRATLARLENALPIEAAAFRDGKTWSPPSTAEVRSLFNDYPDAAHFQNGAYAGKPRLFLFCRHDRNYACLLAMKDKDDHAVRNGATLWTQPGLGLSGYGKPYNERLGNTPQGVHLVDSVMPEANDVPSFGRFRRMILEFPPASANETDMKRLLPPAVYGSGWWKESAVARDIGRGELRIHGTGEHNDRPDVLFYPFIATIGCVAQRELQYGSVNYIDQRLLLDQVMRAQGLAPKFENEPSIKALLYVIDIDDKHAAVTPADLARYDIK